jgi:hypothetical protein
VSLGRNVVSNGMLATSNSGVLSLPGRQDRAMALASRARRPPRPVPRAPLGPAVALGSRMDLCPLQLPAVELSMSMWGNWYWKCPAPSMRATVVSDASRVRIHRATAKRVSPTAALAWSSVVPWRWFTAAVPRALLVVCRVWRPAGTCMVTWDGHYLGFLSQAPARPWGDRR